MSNVTLILTQAPVNWLDDYLEWLDADAHADTSSTCCHVSDATGEFCDVKRLRSLARRSRQEQALLKSCRPCAVNRTSFEFPTDGVVLGHIQSYLRQNPSETCIKAGHAMYGDAVNLHLSGEMDASSESEVNAAF